jgi:hypothetical protein
VSVSSRQIEKYGITNPQLKSGWWRSGFPEHGTTRVALLSRDRGTVGYEIVDAYPAVACIRP